MSKYILILLCCMLLPACVATSRDVETVQYEMDMRLDKRISQLEEEIQRTRELLDARIAEENQPVRSTQANLWSELENLKVKVATLEARLDELDRFVPRVQEDLHNATQAASGLTVRLQGLEQEVNMIVSQLGLDQQPPTPAANATTAPPFPATPEEPAEQSLYDRALSSFNDRKYEQAQTLWAEFAESYPDHELVPNALFWQGESYYQLKDYGRAVLAYQEVIERFPASNKYPAALLKQGLSFYALGKDKAGRLLLEEVIQKYPQSAEARRARLFLQSS